MSIDLVLDEVGRMKLPISGCDLAYIRVDFAFSMVIVHSLGDFALRIDNEFLYRDHGGERVLDAEQRPEELGPLLPIARSGITDAVAHSTGRLDLAFQNGASLSVPPSEDYEAWQLSGPGGLRVISLPGGDLAIWQYRAN